MTHNSAKDKHNSMLNWAISSIKY